MKSKKFLILSLIFLTSSFALLAMITAGIEWTLNGSDLYPTNYSSAVVGIGTTTPRQSLDIVNGDITLDNNQRIRWNNVASNSLFRSGAGLSIADTLDVSILLDSTDISTTRAFKIVHDGTTVATSTELFRVQENGNVGIGTTNPTQTLSVIGDLNITGTSYLGSVVLNSNNITTNNILSNSGLVKIWSVLSATNGLYVSGNSNSSIDGSTLFVSAGNNRIGIGTTNPTQTLSVIGNSDLTGSLNVNGTLYVSALWNRVGIGIGETLPTASLDVNGVIRTRAVSKGTCSSSVAGTFAYEVFNSTGTFYGCRQTGNSAYYWAQLN